MNRSPTNTKNKTSEGEKFDRKHFYVISQEERVTNSMFNNALQVKFVLHQSETSGQQPSVMKS